MFPNLILHLYFGQQNAQFEFGVSIISPVIRLSLVNQAIDGVCSKYCG